MQDTDKKVVIWRFSIVDLISLLLVTCGLIYVGYDGLDRMVANWFEREEYSHGSLIPAISAFLIWQKWDVISKLPTEHSNYGTAIVVAGVITFFLGEISAISVITQYSFIIILAGMVLSLVGWNIFKHIWIAFVFLVFMIPLPAIIFIELSSGLQLISSKLGVAFIRLFDISVYLEGNVIDLGVYKLQVIEACSGLRYLFPLMSLAFIVAYFYDEKFWKKATVFFSSIPITVILNSIRIGIIGVLVEYYGIGMAEGFLHDFEGWVVFMVCIAILVLEMWVLTVISDRSKKLVDVFSLELPEAISSDEPVRHRKWPRSYQVSLVIIVALIIGSSFVKQRVEDYPARATFDSFPMQLVGMEGKRDNLEVDIINKLQFDDYIVANYISQVNHSAVSFYSAYYNSQRKGASIHSPRACLPGGGWKVDLHEDHVINDVASNGEALTVNRVVIKKGEYTQLVYYWFKQRDRYLTNEYAIKWYLFWDAMTKNRTDGALVRLVTVVKDNETIEDADRSLESFTRQIYPKLIKYIPD